MGENRRRSVQELNLIDDFLFSEAMLHKETAELMTRIILERALGITAENLIIEPQKIINGVDTGNHGIRMDVSVTEIRENNKSKDIIRIYDIEPNNMNSVNLPQRSRYYQSLTDVKLLSSGTDYNKLPELITIWILPYDPFGKNYMTYFVKNMVEGFDDIYYNDGMSKVFLYTDGEYGGNSELKNLLIYIKNSRKNNVSDMQLEKLHLGVEWLRKSSEIGVKYMQMWEIVEHEKKLSWQEGEKAERSNGIEKMIEVLREMKVSNEAIIEKIMDKYGLDEEIAKTYLKLQK